ncbi:hypothetical protein [Nocardia jiangsuensis]|uniref:Uncharacterized protein n=1 Tax=Nocardia jiangsuensis TaxID=1691563 RepID=A0ABV8E1M8_9NOCA
MALLRSRAAARPGIDLGRVESAVAALELVEPVFTTCPWQPRDLVITGLRQWLRCCGAALRDDRMIGMPSHAVDEAWHGLILCTERYAEFCAAAYGRFLHHYPDGAGPRRGEPEPMERQLGRTVVAWSLVARPGERCVLWDLDTVVGVQRPWGVCADQVAAVESELARLAAG